MRLIDVLIALQLADGDDVYLEIWLHRDVVSWQSEFDAVNCWCWLTKWPEG